MMLGLFANNSRREGHIHEDIYILSKSSDITFGFVWGNMLQTDCSYCGKKHHSHRARMAVLISHNPFDFTTTHKCAFP